MPINLPLTERISYSPNIAKSPYYQYAEELTTLVHQRFPLGAVNRCDLWETLPQDKQIAYLDALEQYSNMTIAITRGQGDLHAFLNFIASVNYGSCELIASYAEGYMRLHYPKVLAEVMYLNEHAILVIGRLPQSNPNDIRTWGSKGIIYDFWAQLYYLISDFPSVQKQAPHIPNVLKVMDGDTGKFIKFIPSMQHYLAGTPRVTLGELSASYDILYKSWVDAEEKRATRQKAPAISLFHQPFPPQLLTKYNLENADPTALEKGLRRAAASGDATDLEIFIKYVENINAIEPTKRQTAFHLAAISGSIACCQALKKAGANNEMPDTEGKTARHYLEAFLRAGKTLQAGSTNEQTQQGTTLSA